MPSPTTSSQSSTASRDQGTHSNTAGNTAEQLMPLIVDIAVPFAGYYVLHSACGLSTVMSLALSSVVPVVRTVAGLIRDHRVNVLAALMLVVNSVSILLSFVTGDARLMLAKDSGVSSVIAFAILISILRGRPLMSAGLKPFATKGLPDRVAAWDRLTLTSREFLRHERRFSLVWGLALLAECVARVVGAFTLPVSTMVWLSTALTIGAIGIAAVGAGGIAGRPIEELIDAECRTA